MPEILEVRTKPDLVDFIKSPLSLYGDDPFYAPMPVFEQKKIFSPKNPFYLDADVRLFLAKEDGRIRGRVASIVNRRHLAAHDDGAGFFGFFECVNDPGVAKALLNTVSEELRRAGLKLMRGPMNFSTNEECGFLVEGFESPPMLMTPYNPSYYGGLVEACGMRKSKDLVAFIRDLREELQEKVERVASIAERRGVKTRPVVMRRLREELRVFKEIYNDAWKDNWGFIPITDGEVEDMAKRLKGILVTELTLIAEKDGGPVGFLGLVPDFNQVLRRLGGGLGPVQIAKAIYYSRKIDALRLLLFGIKQEWRGSGADALLMRDAFRAIRRLGRFERVELSWMLEDNLPVIRIAEMVGGILYKRFRIYEKEL
jgi:GNAT superfamily N-acetyltransferase